MSATLTRRSRSDLVPQAARLRAQGLVYREIAETLGISRSYANDLILDPDGSKTRARRDSYGGECRICGARTTGSDGRAKAPDLCMHCAPSEYLRKWTAGTIISAIERWHSLYDQVPSAACFSPAIARQTARKVSPGKRDRYLRMAARYEAEPGAYPHPGIVKDWFGSFDQALIAAGFEPHLRSRNSGPSNAELLDALRALAARLGKTPSMKDWNEAEGMPLASSHGVMYRFSRARPRWSDVCRAAGLEPNPPGWNGVEPHWTHERIIAAIHDWVSLYAETPKAHQWTRAGLARPTSSTVSKRFGSWNAAIAASGYRTRRARGGKRSIHA